MFRAASRAVARQGRAQVSAMGRFDPFATRPAMAACAFRPFPRGRPCRPPVAILAQASH
jgi:hypothetical protein